jgi:alpha-L-rhamnosidase
MASVVQNKTIQEFWDVRPDTAEQWSHCALSPISVLFTDIAGIRPAAPGFARCQVRPQFGDLAHLNLTTYTVRGPIRLVAELVGDQHHVSLTLPPDCAGELLLPPDTASNLQPLAAHHPLGLSMFRLDPGKTHQFSLLSMRQLT